MRSPWSGPRARPIGRPASQCLSRGSPRLACSVLPGGNSLGPSPTGALDLTRLQQGGGSSGAGDHPDGNTGGDRPDDDAGGDLADGDEGAADEPIAHRLASRPNRGQPDRDRFEPGGPNAGSGRAGLPADSLLDAPVPPCVGDLEAVTAIRERRPFANARNAAYLNEHRRNTARFRAPAAVIRAWCPGEGGNQRTRGGGDDGGDRRDLSVHYASFPYITAD